MNNMEVYKAEGVQNPFLDSEKAQLVELVSPRAARTYILERIAYYQERTRHMVQAAEAGLEQTAQVEWRQAYEALDYLYDELSKLPVEEPELVDPTLITHIESIEQLSELYRDETAEFPRLSKEAVENAFRLYAGTNTLNSIVLMPGDDPTIGKAFAQLVPHKRGAFNDPSLLRGPVIHETKEGELVHFRYGVEIRQRP